MEVQTLSKRYGRPYKLQHRPTLPLATVTFFHGSTKELDSAFSSKLHPQTAQRQKVCDTAGDDKVVTAEC